MKKINSARLGLAGPPPDDSFDKAIEDHEIAAAEAPAPRIPPSHGGLQLNFCKDPQCSNFGIAEELAVAKWSRDGTSRYLLAGKPSEYAPYNPRQIDKILGIFRTFHNYIHLGDDDKLSPAMRLGLAKGPVSY